MALQEYVDKVGPVVSAAWLNAVDLLKETIFENSTTKELARVALTSDAPLEVENGGTGSRSGVAGSLWPLLVGVETTVVDYNYPPGDIRRYGTDETGLALLLDVCQQGLAGYIPKGTTVEVVSWTQYVATLPVHLYGEGTISGLVSSIFLQPESDLILRGITFLNWLQVAENDSDDAGTVMLDVQDCVFTGMAANTFDIERPVSRVYIRGNRFSDCANYNIRIGKNDYSLQDTWEDVIIIENTFDNITSSGTATAAAAIVYGKKAVISKNIVDGVDATAGTGEAHGFYTKARQSVIEGNVISNVTGAGGAATVTGLNIKGNVRGATSAPQGYNSVVANNVVKTVLGYGIRMQCDDSVIASNIVEDADTAGIFVDADGDNFIVNGNKVYQSIAGTSYGILLSANGQLLRVVDNLIDGTHQGILVSAGDGEVIEHLLVAGNLISCEANAMRLSLVNAGEGSPAAAADGTINYCEFKNNHVALAQYGILTPATDGVTTGLVIEGNDLRGATVGKLSTSFPAGTRVRNNLGYVSENGGVVTSQATGATVTHGCSDTPTNVSVNALGTGVTGLAAITIGATTFTLSFSGGGSHDFSWEAKTAEYYG